MRPGQTVVCIGVISLLLFSITTDARANFVDDFLHGYGFCSYQGPHYHNGSAFEVDPKEPFGKAASEWTDDDLAHLHEAFQICHSQALQSGRRHEPMNYGAFEAAIPKVVERARAEVKQQTEDSAAAERQRQAQQQREADAVQSARINAEADRKRAEDDRAAAQKQAEITIARDQALIAAAHARRDATLARQKAAAVEAEVKAAQAEANEVENVKPVKPDIPAVKTPETKAVTPLAGDPEYREVSVTDLQLDGNKLVGEKVIVRGFVNVFADQGATIYRHEDDMNGVDLHMDSAPEATRRYIVEHCGRLTRTCRMVVEATVVVSDTGKAELDLD